MLIHPLIFVFAASKVHSASDFPEMSPKEIFCQELGGGNSHIFGIFIPKLRGKMIFPL